MKNVNTQLRFAAAMALAMAALSAVPAQAADEPKPDHEVSFNAAVTTDYRFRGLSQTRLDPALQGGADYINNPTGLYVGTWLSTIRWIKDLGGDANVEWDIYGGKKGEIVSGVSYDVGGLYYFYPSNSLGPNANTFEVYGQLGYGPAYVKYSHSTTNLFGTANSKNSGYLDVGANIEVASGLVLNLHVGHQRVKHSSNLSYTDYKVGLTKDFGYFALSLAAVKATTNAYVGVAPEMKNLGRPAAVLAISKTF
jgi:uncharacterized protein (TIGR02001 family)